MAGTLSTVLFTIGMLPMVVKAVRTKDLASYSLGSLVLTNVANAVHSIYVFNLPAGPIWVLHLAYVLASALMLAWWLRYGRVAQGHDEGPRPGKRWGSVKEIAVGAALTGGGERS